VPAVHLEAGGNGIVLPGIDLIATNRPTGAAVAC